MSSAVAELTDATFDEVVVSSAEPVVVEFWAQWCPPCRTMAPVLESMAADKLNRERVKRHALFQPIKSLVKILRSHEASPWCMPGILPPLAPADYFQRPGSR